MRRALVIILAFAAFAALTAGGTWMWRHRPWRIVATVDGDVLTSRDLDLRIKAYCGGRPVTESDRREMVRAWIAKQILLGEAVRRNASLSETDERVVKGVLVAWLASQGTTADDFFAEGPLPEDVKRNDFKEGLLIHALVREVLGKEPFAAFYRPLHEKALVQCPEFPELERPGGELPLYAGLWGWRPARVSIAAAGQVVTSAELDLRVRNAQDDLRRRGFTPPAVSVLRRHEAQVWIFKVVMEGVLPESLKMEDFRANIRVNKLLVREVDEKANVSGTEIEARMAELRRRAADEAARGLKPTTRSDRKTAINDLRMERHNKGCRAIFRSLYGSARVWSPEFPEMERLDGVSLPLPNEKEALK